MDVDDRQTSYINSIFTRPPIFNSILSCVSPASSICLGWTCCVARDKVITLSHILLGSPRAPRSPQGVPKEYKWTSPSIALVLPDSKDSLRTPQGLLKDFIGSPQGVPQDSLYNPHKEGTFPGVVPPGLIKDSTGTPSLY